MLSLDISGAYDHVSTERLLWILQRKGLPEWIAGYVRSFIRGRRTRVAFDGYESNWIQVNSGIPQGSPLSPILFLFFISELLEGMQNAGEKLLAFGFIDDTNLITWGSSAQENCRRLEEAHHRCIDWATRHGTKFAPDKYKLIHLSKRRRDPNGDLASAIRIRIQDHEEEVSPETKLRVLGVWVDPKMNWKEHATMAAGKGNAAFEALSRIVASTWGPSVGKAKIIYTAAVRPAMMHGIQSWYIGPDGKQATGRLKQLELVQNKCLRRITGGYRRTPRAALERETRIPPLDVYSESVAMNRALKDKDSKVTEEIRRAVETIWETENPPQTNRRQGRGRPRRDRQRPPTSPEKALQRAIEIEMEMQGYRASQAQRVGDRRRRRGTTGRRGAEGPNQPMRASKSGIDDWAEQVWKRRWQQAARNKRATTWNTPWKQNTLKLYSDQPKHQATALFLLRTEVIGLNAWLASVNVPNIRPECGCGWQAQTVRHVLAMCPLYSNARAEMLRQTNGEAGVKLLTNPAHAQIVARWFVKQGVLSHLNTAREIDEEDTEEHTPFQPLEEAE
jgi:hypothetical protein